MRIRTYPQLYRWLDGRAALSREIRYCLSRPAPGPEHTTMLNTRTVRCRPRRGTSNPDPGVYRQPNPNVLLDMHARIGRLCPAVKPRLVKPVK